MSDNDCRLVIPSSTWGHNQSPHTRPPIGSDVQPLYTPYASIIRGWYSYAPLSTETLHFAPEWAGLTADRKPQSGRGFWPTWRGCNEVWKHAGKIGRNRDFFPLRNMQSAYLQKGSRPGLRALWLLGGKWAAATFIGSLSRRTTMLRAHVVWFLWSISYG